MNTTHVKVTEKRVNRGAVRLALGHLKRLRRLQAEYDEEVRTWYARGEGRSPNWRTEITEDGEVYRWNAGGSGYRFPACFHGTSLWTDYDNICGPCEDGLTLQQQALFLGHEDWHVWSERTRVVIAASEAGVPHAILTQLQEWSLEVLDRAGTRTVRNLP